MRRYPFRLINFRGPIPRASPTSGNVFFGYSYDNTNFSNIGRANLNGFEASVEGRIFPGVGIVADFTTTYGSQIFNTGAGALCHRSICTGNVNLHVYQAVFGPRFSASLGKFRPFAEFEFGVAHVTTSAPCSDTSFRHRRRRRPRLPNHSPHRLALRRATYDLHSLLWRLTRTTSASRPES